jgi:hypothetical protein
MPIQGQDVGLEHFNLLDLTTNEVVPFKNALCWVDYNIGVLYCEDVCGDNPKATFAGFPPEYSSYHPSGQHPRLYRSLCATPKVGARWRSLMLAAMMALI